MNLLHLLDLSLKGRRPKAALEWQAQGQSSQTLTFGDIDRRSNQYAHAIQERGLQAGDRLCAYLKNSPEYIYLYLGCLKSGVIFVPVNILYREHELNHIVTDAEPKAIVAAEAATLPAAVWTTPELTKAASAMPETRPRLHAHGDTPALIMYTSGTTGRAKGAVITHNNLAANALALVTLWQIAESDRFLLTLPLFHVHGLGFGVHCWLVSGCHTRLLERLDQSTTEQTFLEYKPSVYFGVPTTYSRLAAINSDVAKKIGNSMRLWVCGSAPLPAQLLNEFKAKFGQTILERYGMTETMVNMTNPYIGERRAGSVGLPVPGLSVRLLDAEGHPVADGEIGEVYVRGPSIFAGYWKNEAATTAAFIDGYFRTGDLGVRAPDGYYTLHGRATDMIISGGFNIYPREVEDFLQAQVEVAEVAVIGIPDDTWGEVPVAYVVAASPFDTEELKARCKAALASFKTPKQIHLVDQLPRNAMGKVDKPVLRQTAQPDRNASIRSR